MTEVATRTIEDGIGIVSIDSPPVNALGAAVRRGLQEQLGALSADDAVRAVVLICKGRTFFAGADISEFDKPMEEPTLAGVFDIMENGAKPVIAAIHGTALGGGFELALIAPFRIAVPSARFGLPEVNLGLLPGAGGTQRLPRLIGPAAALDLMTSGRTIGALEAFSLGVIDALAEEGQLRADAIALARRILAENRPALRIRDRQDKVEAARGDTALFADFRRKHARTFRGFKAPENIVKAVEAAVALPFDRGIAREQELFGELVNSTESLAQRYAFFAERATAKIPGIVADASVAAIESIGVIGAGTMGGGIAMNFLSIGVPVTILDTSQAALDRGIASIRRNYEAMAAKGRLSAEEVERHMTLLTPALDLGGVAGADLVIEAAFESMDVKRDIFGKLDAIAKDGAILASNTSFLDVDAIAAATGRPEQVVGLHFFSPANVMRLLEVVRGAKTADAVIATAMKLAKRIGKMPVLAGVCHGFIANRLMEPRGHQAELLVAHGPTPTDIDRVLYDYGFAMGHFRMMDLVGLDVIGREATHRSITGDLAALGRLGQKGGGGFYDYDDKRQATPSPVAADVIAVFAREVPGPTIEVADDAQTLAWLLYPVVNEGARILEEGIALRASDIDVAATLGYGWPVYTGGPMFWADTVGLSGIVATLDGWAERFGDRYAPSPLLRRLAETGSSFTRG